jgi:hypothetical protein
MNDDIEKAMETLDLENRGQRIDAPHAGKIAQLLAYNAYSRENKVVALIKLPVENGSRNAPLDKAMKLMMDARQDITRPFESISQCLQSCFYDVLLCYTAFWGQVFEYYKTMYHKPVHLPDGGLDTRPAKVTFEGGWQLTCLFIRDIMLSEAAKLAGAANPHQMGFYWFFYPPNGTGYIEEAKSIVLTVMGEVRQRDMALVGNKGSIGHISHSLTTSLKKWVQDNLFDNWNNTERLDALSVQYFDSNWIQVNIDVTRIFAEQAVDTMNQSFRSRTSTLETREELKENCARKIISGRVTIRPVTPILLGSRFCEWNSIEMGVFCREIALKCQWPEVVNIVEAAGQRPCTLINRSAEVKFTHLSGEKRESLSVPSKLSFTPDSRRAGPILPMPTSPGMPGLELTVPQFRIPIPELTPTPRGLICHLQPPPTPRIGRRRRDSEVTFSGDDDRFRPLDFAEESHQAIVVHPSDLNRSDFSDGGSPSPSSRAALGGAYGSCWPHQMHSIADIIAKAARRDFSSKNWSIEKALGIFLREGESIQSLYNLIHADLSNLQETDNARTRAQKRKSSDMGSPGNFPVIDSRTLMLSDDTLNECLKNVEKRSMKNLNKDQKNSLRVLSRVLALASICDGDSSKVCLRSAVAVSADLVAFCHSINPMIPQTDVFATGLRSAYAAAMIAMIEAAKDVGISDWYRLSLFFNHTAYIVLLYPNRLFDPTTRTREVPRQETVQNHMSTFERLQPHCFFVSSELMMRWAWAPGSKLWIVHGKLTGDYFNRRHEFEGREECETDEIEQFNHFVKLCLLNAGQYLSDLGQRLKLPDYCIHASFDIVRATILLRPEILKGRHMYHIVYCALVAATTIFSPPPVAFERLIQAAIMREPNPDVQAIIRDYVCESVCLSSAGAAVLFSDCSAALVLPNASGIRQPEYQLAGRLQIFYETIFVGEMRQILFNIRKITRPNDLPHLDLGPYPRNADRDPSLSPFAFISLSSSLAIAMQQNLGEPGIQTRTEHYQHFQKAMTIVSPLGVLPCLLPPIKRADVPIKGGEKIFKWMNDSAIKVMKNGGSIVIELAYPTESI